MQISPNIFERVEKKYLLSDTQLADLMRALDGRMSVDAYGKHSIQNIYYDTPDFDLIRTSLDHPYYKEKLRVRSYGVPGENDPVYVELKKKYGGVVYKRRVSMTLRESNRYLRLGKQPADDSQILREIDYALNFYGAQPMMCISYDRVALFDPGQEGFRITLDANIRFRTTDLYLEHGPYGTEILPPRTVLMEVKTVGALPLWFAGLLSGLSIYPASFSKYGQAYLLLQKRFQTEGVTQVA